MNMLKNHFLALALVACGRCPAMDPASAPTATLSQDQQPFMYTINPTFTSAPPYIPTYAATLSPEYHQPVDTVNQYMTQSGSSVVWLMPTNNPTSAKKAKKKKLNKACVLCCCSCRCNK